MAEAQERLSLAEFRQWVKYRAKRGSLNWGMRIERGTALLATLYANSHSKDGGYKIYDFMQHDAERPVSLEQAMESWA
ncbi:phage tail assembly protein T [Pseudomonas paraversuta]|uniref:phage tail assembly protein T n=1 Tax=Pseudomonas paraversuta TaxID=2750624 RepID=UPI003D2B34A2